MESATGNQPQSACLAASQMGKGRWKRDYCCWLRTFSNILAKYLSALGLDSSMASKRNTNMTTQTASKGNPQAHDTKTKYTSTVPRHWSLRFPQQRKKTTSDMQPEAHRVCCAASCAAARPALRTSSPCTRGRLRQRRAGRQRQRRPPHTGEVVEQARTTEG